MKAYALLVLLLLTCGCSSDPGGVYGIMCVGSRVYVNQPGCSDSHVTNPCNPTHPAPAAGVGRPPVPPRR